MKKIKNDNGSFSLWDIKENRFLVKNTTEDIVDNLIKIIKKKVRDEKALRKGVR